MQITVKSAVGIVVLSGVAGAAGALLANRASPEAEPIATVQSQPGAFGARLQVEEGSTPSRSEGKAFRSPATRPVQVGKHEDAQPAPNAQLPATEPPRTTALPELTEATEDPTPPAVTNDTQPGAARPVAEPEPLWDELVVAKDAVIGLEMDSTLSSETGRIEDSATAHVLRDVRVADRVAIPAGARVHGEVILLERGGRLRDRARIGVRFTSVTLPGGRRTALATAMVVREGDAPARSSASKIGGGATIGAIVGGILGGGKGAVIGGAAGAGAGTAAVLADERRAAVLAAGTAITVQLTQPVTVQVER